MPDDPYGNGLRPWRMLYAAAGLAFLGLFEAWTRGQWPDTRAFVDISSTVVPLLAGALAIARSRRLQGSRRTSWVLLACAAFSWGLGNLAWTWYEVVLGIEAPLPSWADAGYLLFLPLAAAGLAVLVVGRTATASRTRSILDGLLLAGSLLFISWGLFLRPIVDAALAQSGLAAQVVSLAYPVGDLALVALLLLDLSRAVATLRSTLLWVGASLVALTVADIGYWWQNAKGTYVTGSVTDVGWVAAFILLGYASLRPIGTRDTEETRPGLAMTVLPTIPLAVAAVAAVADEVDDGQLTPFLFWTALLLLAVLVVRQFLIVVENIGLRRQAETALDLLHGQQAERTLMLNTVTHDILSPLSAVRIQAAVLAKREDFDDKAQRSVAIVGRNVEAVSRMARDLKDLANLEAGQFRLESAPFDLAELARQACDSFRDATQQAGLAMRCEVQSPLPVRGDHGRLDQVLYNLLSNAIRYTKAGEVSLWAHARKGHVEVAVRDTGRGLDPDEIARLFKPFSQVHERSEAREKGTGLGLFISRSIAQSHGGTLRVESLGHGKGSTFFLEMPLDPSQPLQAKP